MLRRIALCLCFLTLLLPLLSCQPGAPGPVALQTDIQAQAPSSERREIELVLWTHEFPTYTEGLRTKWIPEFEALHPGVTIKYEIFPYSGSIVSFDSKLLADVFSGSGPDVWAMASHNFTQAEYIEAGMLAPLDLSLFGYDSIADLEQDYPKNSLSIFIQDGKVYGLLNELTTLCLYYNKTMFDAAGIVYPLAQNPSSWQTLGESSQQLLKIDLTSGVPEQMGYQFGFLRTIPRRNGISRISIPSCGNMARPISM